MAKRDPHPVQCWHKAAHQHGTIGGYRNDRCGCEPCRRANARYNKAHRLAQARGRGRYLIDASVALAVVGTLRSRGFSVRGIARLSGISEATLVSLVTGRTRSVTPATARSLVALRDSGLQPRVGSLASMRRLQGLAALGWSTPAIARLCGMSDDTVRRVMHGKRTSVSRQLSDSIEAAAQAVGDRSPGLDVQCSSVTVKAQDAARARGWLVPAWWDEDTIADPKADPTAVKSRPSAVDWAVVERVLDGARMSLTVAERAAVVRILNGRGMSDLRIAEYVQADPLTVLRIRHRHGIAAAA